LVDGEPVEPRRPLGGRQDAPPEVVDHRSMVPQAPPAQKGSRADAPRPARCRRRNSAARCDGPGLASAYHGGRPVLPIGVQLEGEESPRPLNSASTGTRFKDAPWCRPKRRSRNIPSAPAPRGRANGMSLGSRSCVSDPPECGRTRWRAQTKRPDLRIRGPVIETGRAATVQDGVSFSPEENAPDGP
jgi:hypothetical protein